MGRVFTISSPGVERKDYSKVEKLWYYKVKAPAQDRTVERILKTELGLTRKQISRLKFQETGIRVNGSRQRVSYQLQSGDTLCVQMEEKELSGQLLGMDGELKILYEDEDLIALDKPSGQVCHPSGCHYRDSLANQLAFYYRSQGQDSVVRMVGRLDRDTSGIVVAAKNRIAAQRLFNQREKGEFCKEYLAVAHGRFACKEGKIKKPIAQVGSHPLRMCASHRGKEAETEYKVLGEDGDFSLVRCRLYTGRTHQIRVHMGAIGHPLVNDSLYGVGEGEVFARWLEGKRTVEGERHRQLGLHAWKLCLRQPFSGEQIQIHSPCCFEQWLGG